jgi:hypothetical protein
MGRLDVTVLTPPARFPTVVFDPGDWWHTVAATGHHLRRLDLNGPWWRLVCSAEGLDLLGLPRRSAGLGRMRAASRALDALRSLDTFRNLDAYVNAIAAIERYLEEINGRSEVFVGFDAGPILGTVDYRDSRSLLEAADGHHRLRHMIEFLLRDETAGDVLVVSATCPEDLLTSLIVASILKSRRPSLHVCLADHGWENFTLRAHLPVLQRNGTLAAMFDTVVESKDERDVVVADLVARLSRGEAPRGLLRAGIDPAPAPPAARVVVPPTEVFAPEPILMTRLSPRRCYWSRCTFCVHNLKHEDPRPLAVSEVTAGVDRLEGHLEAGYRLVSFSDEALSPGVLARLAGEIRQREIIARFPAFRWTARSKLERGHTPDLIAALVASGCAELLFGVETVGRRTLAAMDKLVPGLGPAETETILTAAGTAGLGVHVNLIGDFPGSTFDELADSIEVVGRVLAASDTGSFILNDFVVFPATPIADDPARFGVTLGDPGGDMPAIVPHRGTGHEPSPADLQVARSRLMSMMGLDRLARRPHGGTALRVLFGTGHSTVWKARSPGLLEGSRTREERRWLVGISS